MSNDCSLQQSCTFHGDTDPEATRSLLKLYAEQSIACHSPIKELLKKKDRYGLAKLIAEDLCWLETEAPKLASVRHLILAALQDVRAL